MLVIVQAFLKSKGFSRTSDGFHGCFATAIVAHLVASSTLVPSMQPHQAFKAVVQYLATRSLGSENGSGIVLGCSQPLLSKPLLEPFLSVADCVVLDLTGSVNLAARVTLDACAELQHVCVQCLDTLSQHKRLLAPFHVQAAVLDPVPPAVGFDVVLNVTVPPQPVPGSLRDQNSLCDLSWADIVARRVAAVSRRALGDRVTHLRVLSVYTADGPWPAADTIGWDVHDEPQAFCSLLLGVRLDGAHWLRRVDRGPPAVQHDAALAFRAFWGEVAELQRFPDGSIVEGIGT